MSKNANSGQPQIRIRKQGQSAFTIVELLIVIVIIGILAAITIVSYSGITGRANTAALQSDTANASKKLALYYAENNTYPTAIDPTTGCPTAPVTSTEYCIKTNTTSNTINYYGNTKNFTLTISKNNTTDAATTTNDSAPKTISLAQPTNCPTGFIPVPGSATYGTKGFCVMKYEAKNDGSNNAVSTAAGTPYVNISQTDAITKSQNVAGCTGCHLITEAQWMTLAQNVLSVNSNWSGGTVGNGYIFRGHNDNVPANSLAAVASDSDGYNGTGQSSGDQKRTLTLTNGEVIWDMAGNVWEWTTDQTTGNQPGIATAGYNWTEWPNVTVPGGLSVNVSPAGTGLTGASTWTQANGVGELWSNTAEAGLRGFRRGGDWRAGAYAGVLNLGLGNAPGNSDSGLGFRVSRD